MDLCDLWREDTALTWRKLDVLVSQLPPESATSTALRLDGAELDVEDLVEPDPEAEQWSRTEHLLAAVRDELHFLRYAYVRAHSDPKATQRWKPEPLPRPGISPSRQALSSPQLSLLARHLDRTQPGAA